MKRPKPSVDRNRFARDVPSQAKSGDSLPGSKMHGPVAGLIWMSALGMALTWLLSAPEPLPIFANRRLLLAHLLFAVPLAWMIVFAVRRFEKIPWWWSILCCILCLGLAELQLSLSDGLLTSQLGFAGRWSLRFLASLIFAILWLACLPRWPHGLALKNSTSSWLLCALIGVIPTVTYSIHELRRTVSLAEQQMASQFVVRAIDSIQAAIELDDTVTISGNSAKQQLLQTIRQQQQLEERLSRSATPSSHSSANDSASVLLALNRVDEAIDRLRQDPNRDTASFLLEAVCHREQGNWKGTWEACEAAKPQREQFSSNERLRWYELTGESLTRLRRPKDAIDCFEEAAKQCPEQAAAFEFQTAIQLAELGDVRGAIARFHALRTEQPIMSDAIDRQVTRLKTQSCVLPFLPSTR